MTGAESLVATLAGCGVEICFANPGTSELHFLAALENPRLRSVLCLFEGVATGAADGWYRMRDRPACTLLHLGPGLANGSANLHNARRAASGIVNIVGDHATSHLRYDAPLTSDVGGLARVFSHFVRRSETAGEIATDIAAAVARAGAHPAEIATLILPGDASWGEASGGSAGSLPKIASKLPDAAVVAHAARVLRGGEPTLLILGGKAARGQGLGFAGQIAAATGCRIATQFFTPRIERGAGRVSLERIPYAVPAALKFLAGFRHIITVETGEPIAFFGYPDQPSRLKPADCVVHGLAESEESGIGALEMLADALGARAFAPRSQERSLQAMPSGALDPLSIAAAITVALPEGAILVDESVTTGRETLGLTAGAAPHDVLQNMGGSIGFGTPVATGAACACPDRPVVCMVGDGSAMYTIQSLWTQAREGLNVTTIIFANNKYQILNAEFANMGIGNPGPRAGAMTDIGRPRIDWVAMGTSMGCPSVSVDNAGDFARRLADAVREPGPKLIEVRL